jgi:RNA:NAD 2'-phosphotransferase (TPT1/KptA family)
MTIMDKRLIRVSKHLAKYLRHSPDELGLTLRPGGCVTVDDLRAAASDHGFPISYDELVECVETNDNMRRASSPRSRTSTSTPAWPNWTRSSPAWR